MAVGYSEEVIKGERFEFGNNWTLFVESINEGKLKQAEESLCKMLKTESLKGKRFLDVGSGSGLFSLAARRLGATVHSFDYDEQSVACTNELKHKYFPNDKSWSVEHGSVTDKEYLKNLGQWDIVYSWGVLHHTGDMSHSLENVANSVCKNGQLFIAIYNDQGRNSKFWLKIKQAYNKLPKVMRWLVLFPAAGRLWGPTTIRDIIKGRPFYTWRNYSKISMRGMSAWRDVVDWVGGLPFEVASPEEIFSFYRDRGFVLEELRTCAGGHGCNEFVFRRA